MARRLMQVANSESFDDRLVQQKEVKRLFVSLDRNMDVNEWKRSAGDSK